VTATPALTTDLKTQVKLLADDLRQRLDADSERLAEWKDIHQEAVTKDRTAMSWVDWREDRIDQAAVAWVLTTVFLRFCEDNSLVKPVWFSGPGNRRQEALDGYNAYFRSNPEHSDREWLESAISYLRGLPATKALVDEHSALEYVAPSGTAVGKLREFWLRRNDDDGTLQHDLQDDELSTRFLGDLYQDLSDYAKDKYALLQTPVFVEEFILDRTLEPALNDRSLDGFRMIDPTCGSGHFLLGAFARLLDRWHKQAPGMEIQARVQTALDAIHGVDLNPFAVAIARFRLTVEALRACELRLMEDAPAFKFHLAVGDSLIHGPDVGVIPGLESRAAFMPFHYSTEDPGLLLEILEESRYDSVVGNPPYILPRDKALNQIYRSKFGNYCKGKYALTVPFAVQFFALAKDGPLPGWAGMITSNSFMKREFGAPLVKFLAGRDLQLVADTSGAFIPGHGTPTVILVGRDQPAVSDRVRAVLGVRGEEGKPENPAEGKVWSSIVGHVDDVGWKNEWINVVELDQQVLHKHPWSLTGGGAIGLQAQIERSNVLLSTVADSIGITSFTLEDEVYIANKAEFSTRGIESNLREMVVGDEIRDWSERDHSLAIFPYDNEFRAIHVEESSHLLRWMWPYRVNLSNNLMFGAKTKIQSGLLWSEYGRLTAAKLRVPLSITFAFVATHNHFVLDRGGKVFNRSAPVIKLPEGATEDAHLELLGLLNSSTACFWLKQVSHDKGNRGGERSTARYAWENFYEFTGTTLEDYPLPKTLPLVRGRKLDRLASESGLHEPSALAADVPSREALASAATESGNIRAQMIAQQEELDWEVYRLYGLLEEDLTYPGDDLPTLALGERAFEIALAREIATGTEQAAWFERHDSSQVTEIPRHWPVAYRDLVQRRLDLIANHPSIKLLEKPEYKRRWSQEPWEKRQEKALRGWLLDRLENRRFWFDPHGRPAPSSVAQLSDQVNRDPDMVSVLALWEGRPDVSVADSLTRLLADEAVPLHSGYRYKDSGLRKRVAWEQTWAQQRLEDKGEKVEVDVPPKYAPADIAKPSYWRHRGKLDVPKERFILYPDASRDGDGTSLLGWAGWDHAEQALALASVINDREQEGWPDERLVPLVAGLVELQPWVEQWHGDVHPTYGVSLAAFCTEELTRRAAQVGMTIDQLRWWRPEKKQRKGRGKA
jgi:hypothetical protein